MDSNLIITPVTGYHWSEGKEIKPWVTEHPAVRTHPKTGLEGLYINRMFTTRFSNMSVIESQSLLEFLFNQMEAYDITFPFKWSKGDVLIWDNRFTLHYPINDFSGVRRKMILTSVMEAI